MLPRHLISGLILLAQLTLAAPALADETFVCSHGSVSLHVRGRVAGLLVHETGFDMISRVPIVHSVPDGIAFSNRDAAGLVALLDFDATAIEKLLAVSSAVLDGYQVTGISFAAREDFQLTFHRRDGVDVVIRFAAGSEAVHGFAFFGGEELMSWPVTLASPMPCPL